MKEIDDQNPALSSDPRWQLAQRVGASETFRRAPRLRSFLFYVVEKTVQNRTADVNEYAIGTAVFERPASFDPADDSLVRSSARQLRAKLHEYFETEGRGETLRIEIPKGAYLPEFPVRPGAVEAATIPAAYAERRRDYRVWGLGVLCVGLAALAAVGWFRETGPVGGGAKPANMVEAIFPKTGTEIDLVLVDSALVVVNGLRPEILTLEQYIRREEQRPVPGLEAVPGSATPSQFPSGRLITSFRDATFAAQLSDLGVGRGWKVTVRHSRLMQSRDFRKGNFVMLGSTWSNPWVALFEDACNFRFTRHAGGDTYGIANIAPRPGEPKFYFSSTDAARNGVSYARIAVAPNLSGAGRVLLVSGLHAESSEAATDALLAPDFLHNVEPLLGGNRIDQCKSLEMLLEARSVDGTVKERKLAALRFSR